MTSNQVMPRVHNGDMRQNLGCSSLGLRRGGVKGGLFLCGHHCVKGWYRQNSGFAGFSTGGFRHYGQLGFSYRLSDRRLTGRISSRRRDQDKISNLERLVRRTVKAEEEQEKKEEFVEKEPKPLAVTPKYTQLGVLVAGARSVLMTVRILTAMMTWVVLFFIVSVWDGDSKSFQDPGKKKGKRGPRSWKQRDNWRVLALAQSSTRAGSFSRKRSFFSTLFSPCGVSVKTRIVIIILRASPPCSS